MKQSSKTKPRQTHVKENKVATLLGMNKNVARFFFVFWMFVLLFAGSLFCFLNNYPLTNHYLDVIGIFALITLCLMSIIFIVEIISAFKIADSTFHTVSIAFFMLLFLLFSSDMNVFFLSIGISINAHVLSILSWISFFGITISIFSFFNYTYFDNERKSLVLPLVIGGIVFSVFYFIFEFTYTVIFPSIFYFALLIVQIIYLLIVSYKKNKDDATFHFSLMILCALIGAENVSVYSFHGWIQNPLGSTSIYFWICMASFIAVYISFYIKIEKNNRHLMEYKLQAEKLKNILLVNQFKPHFIVNVLSKIQSMYHKELKAGDEALVLFSKYLRQSIRMLETPLVLVEKEIENIQNYIDFCNLKEKQKFNVFFNIDETNFFVPPLIIQPFVENAIKYSKVNEKCGGGLYFNIYSF